MEAASRIESSGVNQAPAAGAAAPGTPAPAMDREFIIKNQIVERYLAGRLPPKGVTDFERLIRSRPQLIEELGLADKVNAGLRLLDAAGIAEPWSEKPKKFWEKPAFTMGAAALAVAALIGCAVLGMQVSSRDATIAKQKAGKHRTCDCAFDAQAHHRRGRRPQWPAGPGDADDQPRRVRRNEGRSLLGEIQLVQGVDRSREPGSRRRARRPGKRFQWPPAHRR